MGSAAFFGALMNWNFIMVGVASTNPVLLKLNIFLILAWKVAGWYGADQFLLPLVGPLDLVVRADRFTEDAAPRPLFMIIALNSSARFGGGCKW